MPLSEALLTSLFIIIGFKLSSLGLILDDFDDFEGMTILYDFP